MTITNLETGKSRTVTHLTVMRISPVNMRKAEFLFLMQRLAEKMQSFSAVGSRFLVHSDRPGITTALSSLFYLYKQLECQVKLDFPPHKFVSSPEGVVSHINSRTRWSRLTLNQYHGLISMINLRFQAEGVVSKDMESEDRARDGRLNKLKRSSSSKRKSLLIRTTSLPKLPSS